MDNYQPWTGVYWPLIDVMNEWNRRRKAGIACKRDHEIHAATLLAMALSHHNRHEYVLGLQLLGHRVPILSLPDLFDSKYGEDRDIDLVMARVEDGKARDDLLHPLQITRSIGATSQDPDESVQQIVNSLGRKLRTPPDNRLILLVHLTGPGRSDYFKLNEALVKNNCPFGQVFIVGKYSPEATRRWFCIQVFPSAMKLQDLDFDLPDG